MTHRDLYAACVGVCVVLTVEGIGVFLARPTAWFALLLLTSLSLLLAAIVMHVQCVLKEAAAPRGASPAGSAGESTAARTVSRAIVQVPVTQRAAAPPQEATATASHG